jgi:hypothetical protein
MTMPTDEEVTALTEALDLFTRRYKPLNELNKRVLFYVARHPKRGRPTRQDSSERRAPRGISTQSIRVSEARTPPL